jgi:3-isopropylmalate/(R)-2-methylmalate dehydratase small subunit
MQPLATLSSTVVPLLRDNIDTDTIIPASYLRSLGTDPGSGLFAHWRYRADGSADPAFVLNDPRYRGAQVLLSGANFGCGSSRENAVWALARYGIRCVIALSYSDIFHENCFKNGVLPIVLGAQHHQALARSASAAVPLQVRVDVAAGTLECDGGAMYTFALDERKRAMLLGGLDEIDMTLAAGARIASFREQHRLARPWLYAAVDAAAKDRA